MVVILIGPMGCGKTRVGELLAKRLAWPFIEGDAFHPPANVEKMRADVPLDDADRAPWLATLRTEIETRLAAGGHAVVACSALKAAYRDALGVDQRRVRTVFLKGSRDQLRRRLAGRDHPYMPDELLDSQLATLEAPADGITVEIGEPPEAIVEHLLPLLPLAP